ncbi:hypothetical protein PIB30_024815 [Stylosanthes scabra]|uniref:AT-hook motif nuclear-localized protein n=1 Tax=Stylosanthes scabra TaxID=79078 RepID=A0ABU6XBQ0_9FABA|nr:hypothetical protein [Stylosanthes scabra]
MNNDDDPQQPNNIIVIDDDDYGGSGGGGGDGGIPPLSPSTFNIPQVGEGGGGLVPPFFSPLPSIADTFGQYNITSPQYHNEPNPPYQYLGWDNMDNLFNTIPMFLQPSPPLLLPPPPPSPRPRPRPPSSSVVSSSCFKESNDDDEPLHHQNSPNHETDTLQVDSVGDIIIGSSQPNHHQNSSNTNLPPLFISIPEEQNNEPEPESEFEFDPKSMSRSESNFESNLKFEPMSMSESKPNFESNPEFEPKSSMPESDPKFESKLEFEPESLSESKFEFKPEFELKSKFESVPMSESDETEPEPEPVNLDSSNSPDDGNNISLALLAVVDYSGDKNEKEESRDDEPPFNQNSSKPNTPPLVFTVSSGEEQSNELIGPESKFESDDPNSSNSSGGDRNDIPLLSFPLVDYSLSKDEESSDDDNEVVPLYQHDSTLSSPMLLPLVDYSGGDDDDDTCPMVDVVIEATPAPPPPPPSLASSSMLVSALPTLPSSAIVVPSSSSSCAAAATTTTTHPEPNNNEQLVIKSDAVEPSTKRRKRKRSSHSKEHKAKKVAGDNANVVGFRKGVPTLSDVDLLQAFLRLGTNRNTFLPLTIKVNIKEDVVATMKLMAEEKQANLLIMGTVGHFSLIELLHEGKTTTFKGNFTIISLSGSIIVRNQNGDKIETTTKLSVSVVGADGRVFGGPVHGRLIASFPMQTIVFAMVRKEEEKQKADKEEEAKNVPESSQKEEATNSGNVLYDVDIQMVDDESMERYISGWESRKITDKK